MGACRPARRLRLNETSKAPFITIITIATEKIITLAVINVSSELLKLNRLSALTKESELKKKDLNRFPKLSAAMLAR